MQYLFYFNTEQEYLLAENLPEKSISLLLNDDSIKFGPYVPISYIVTFSDNPGLVTAGYNLGWNEDMEGITQEEADAVTAITSDMATELNNVAFTEFPSFHNVVSISTDVSFSRIILTGDMLFSAKSINISIDPSVPLAEYIARDHSNQEFYTESLMFNLPYAHLALSTKEGPLIKPLSSEDGLSLTFHNGFDDTGSDDPNLSFSLRVSAVDIVNMVVTDDTYEFIPQVGLVREGCLLKMYRDTKVLYPISDYGAKYHSVYEYSKFADSNNKIELTENILNKNNCSILSNVIRETSVRNYALVIMPQPKTSIFVKDLITVSTDPMPIEGSYNVKLVMGTKSVSINPSTNITLTGFANSTDANYMSVLNGIFGDATVSLFFDLEAEAEEGNNTKLVPKNFLNARESVNTQTIKLSSVWIGHESRKLFCLGTGAFNGANIDELAIFGQVCNLTGPPMEYTTIGTLYIGSNPTGYATSKEFLSPNTTIGTLVVSTGIYAGSDGKLKLNIGTIIFEYTGSGGLDPYKLAQFVYYTSPISQKPNLLCTDLYLANSIISNYLNAYGETLTIDLYQGELPS